MYNKGISIIMPCLNEEKTVGICIKKALDSIEKSGLIGEVIIADNGSIDESVKIAESVGAKVVHIDNKGYGSALRGGIEAAEYEYIIMGDADDSYDFSDIYGFIEKLDEGYELVMGNRFKGGIEPGAMPFSHQYIGNPILSGIGKLFFGSSINDFHCGLRAFRKSSIEKLDLCTTGMEFASEMVVKSQLYKLNTTEIPCKLYPDGRNRPPHLRSIPDGLRHLEFLLFYSPKWLFAYPGIIFAILGLLITTIIYMHPIKIGGIQFEVTTMCYSAFFMLIGFQMLQFAVFTGIFGKRIGQFPDSASFADHICIFINKYGYYLSFVICFIGIVGIVTSLISWGKLGFGEVTSTAICKTAILFGSLLAIGIESLIFTLFSRILKIGGNK